MKSNDYVKTVPTGTLEYQVLKIEKIILDTTKIPTILKLHQHARLEARLKAIQNILASSILDESEEDKIVSIINILKEKSSYLDDSNGCKYKYYRISNEAIALTFDVEVEIIDRICTTSKLQKILDIKQGPICEFIRNISMKHNLLNLFNDYIRYEKKQVKYMSDKEYENMLMLELKMENIFAEIYPNVVERKIITKKDISNALNISLRDVLRFTPNNDDYQDIPEIKEDVRKNINKYVNRCKSLNNQELAELSDIIHNEIKINFKHIKDMRRKVTLFNRQLKNKNMTYYRTYRLYYGYDINK